MRKRVLKVRNSCAWGSSEQIVIGNWSGKNQFFNKKNISTICVGPVLIVIRYFLFEKHAFNGLLKVIGILKVFLWEMKIDLS